ncbi:MAG: dCTP deaminase [Candidatus Hodarchaeota archaeon]
MRFLKTKEIEESWKNLIYPPKQLDGVTLDLTVKRIFTFKGQGTLDFGDSEYQPIDLEPLSPEIEDDPKYGWWTLSTGEYIIEYNEILPQNNCLAIVYSHQRLLKAGCFHSSFVVDPSKNSRSILGLLNVNSQGVRIKENARISTALTFRTD